MRKIIWTEDMIALIEHYYPILSDTVLAEKMNVPLLGQIPIVQSICESGDKGTPVALDENTVTGRAFLQLAAAVVRQVDRRNMEMAPTRIVEVHK